MTYWLLPFTFQIVLQSVVVGLFGLIFGRPIGFREGILVYRWWQWFDKRWPFATTIAYLTGVGETGFSARLWFHEVGVHVKQYEEMAVISTIISAAIFYFVPWQVSLAIWATGGPLWLLPGFLTAARYRQSWKALGWKTWRGLYMFSWFERDAYAEEAAFVRNGGGR